MRKILSIILLSLFLSACYENDINYQIVIKNNSQAKQLLEQGLDINQLDYNGTPLCAAAVVDNVKMAEYLLAKGAKVNYGNPDGYESKSPLHTAAAHDSVAVAKILLAHGADITIRNRENLTPLQTAQKENQQGMVQLLSDFEMQKSSWAKTEKMNTSAAYQSFLQAYPDTPFQQTAEDKIAKLKVAEAKKEARQAKLDAMEANLPANVRRDKYMVQLSRYLKQQNYKAALDVFPKLEALPIATDPSLKYFYGEALLKTNQPAKAMQKLYQYINEQGTGAAHYAQALEMINQAESQL